MRRLRILQLICPVGFYGAERWVLALANNLDMEAVEYCDLAVTREDPSTEIELLNYYPEGVGRAHALPMSGRFDLRVVKKLAKVIKQRKIDVVHTHGYKSDLLGVMAARLAGIKCVSTPHGFGENIGLKLSLFVKLGCWSFRFFDRIAPLSEKLCEDVANMGVRNSKITYIQNGVDLREIEGYRKSLFKAGSDSAGKHIGFAGQMIPRKGLKELLDVFDAVWAQDKQLTLSLVGDGEQRKDLEVYARSLASAKNIKFWGFRTDRLEIMRTFDLFVMTSNLEGIPRCLMEALAMELPVAAYDIPGVDLLVQHRRTGLLAPLGDKAELADHWKTLLTSPDYARKVAEQGRLFVQQRFSAERMANEYVDLFRSLLSK